jgi:hypothetical protein
MNELEIQQLILKKMDDFRPAAPQVSVRFFSRSKYFRWAQTVPLIQDEIRMGWYENFTSEFRDPVLATLDDKLIGTCPKLFTEILLNETPKIQRLFIEGAFLSRLFLFLVPGQGWEREEEIRHIMQKHFPLLLAALESIKGMHGTKEADKNTKRP